MRRRGGLAERRFVGLAGADANDLFERLNENLAVAGLAGAGGPLDRANRFLDEFGAYRTSMRTFGTSITWYSAPR